MHLEFVTTRKIREGGTKKYEKPLISILFTDRIDTLSTSGGGLNTEVTMPDIWGGNQETTL